MAGPHAVEPEEEFGMPGGIGGEDTGMRAGLGIGEIASVEVGLGDIDPDGSGSAGEAGFGGDDWPWGRFAESAWHDFGEVEGEEGG